MRVLISLSSNFNIKEMFGTSKCIYIFGENMLLLSIPELITSS